MRSWMRTLVVVATAVALVALFFRNVDLWRVGADIVRAHPGWLLLALASSFLNLAIRAYRWQYLLEPLGRAEFGPALRATAVGFAANAVLPARAGEVIRPYFLARTRRRAERRAEKTEESQPRRNGGNGDSFLGDKIYFREEIVSKR